MTQISPRSQSLYSRNDRWTQATCRSHKINLLSTYLRTYGPVAYPGILFGGGSTNSVEDRGQRERGSGGGSPPVRGSGGSYNLIQEISFHIVNFSSFLVLYRIFMMTTNLFVIVNVKQLRTWVVSEFHCLFSEHLGVLVS